MASFLLPSLLQKRLLRYALSNLEFLDAKTLDLEHLDISWGTKSTLEFRDVPLQLLKLSTLLTLPPGIRLTKARIVLLRITVPVDVYNTPILVEINGVEVKVAVLLDEADSHTKREHVRRQRRHEKGPAQDALPTPADLAASFLQAEPPEEQAELEAALFFQSQDLDASLAGSGDGFSETGTGTGTILALPTFMANFLSGISDRLQVKIRAVILDIDIPMTQEQRPMTESQPYETVTFRIDIEDVDVQGVTTDIRAGSPLESKRSEVHPFENGKRPIKFHNLRGMLIANASVYEDTAKPPMAASPSTAHSIVVSKVQSSHLGHSRSSTRSDHSDHMQALSSPAVSEDSPGDSLANSPQASVPSLPAREEHGRFEDAPEDSVDSSSGVLRAQMSSSYHQSVLDDSGFLSEIIDSQDSGMSSLANSSDNVRRLPDVSHLHSRPQSRLSTPIASLYVAPTPLGFRDGTTQREGMARGVNDEQDSRPVSSSSSRLLSRPRHRLAEKRMSRSQALSNDVHVEHLTRGDLHGLSSLESSKSVKSELETSEYSERSESSRASPSSQAGDLAQSMLFDHKDAESMYMSALSHERPSPSMPGAWSFGDAEGSYSAPYRNALAGDIRGGHHDRDNLGHAVDSTFPNKKKLDSLEHVVPSTDDGQTTRSNLTASDHLQDRMHSASVRSTTGLPDLAASTQVDSQEAKAAFEQSPKTIKQIFNLDTIEIRIPSSRVEGEYNAKKNNCVPASSAASNQKFTFEPSTINNVPGSFSVYSSKDGAPSHAEKASGRTSDSPANHTPQDALQILLGQLDTHVDLGSSRIIYRIVQILLGSPSNTTQISGQSHTKAAQPNVHLEFDKLSLSFFDSLPGTVVSTASSVYGIPLRSPISDILLQSSMTHLTIDVERSTTATKTLVVLDELLLGYTDGNIVSFNADLRTRESARDLKASAGVDLSMEITQTSNATRVMISTLPLHITLDLRRLDETFSWFGGLSSVMTMGNSVVGGAGKNTISPPKSSMKARGVHFEMPIDPRDRSVNVQNKVDARLGGFVLDLVGENCTMGIDTTAVKIVSRDEGVGLAVDKIKVSGPRLNDSENTPAIVAEARLMRLEFLLSPKDVDLDRLLGLITPSKVKYDQDDDILLETLLRQRRQGSVLRVTVDSFSGVVSKFEDLKHLPEMAEEMTRLSTVTKYIPEDDRPGLLALVLIKKGDVDIDVDTMLGSFQLSGTDVELAQITLPSLIAGAVGSVNLRRNHKDELVGSATPLDVWDAQGRSPALMARMIGDEMEPIVKIKLWNLKLEYHVATLMSFLEWGKAKARENTAAGVADSVETLTDRKGPVPTKGSTIIVRESKSTERNALLLDVVIRDCTVGLNPSNLASKIVLVMTESHLAASLPENNSIRATFDMNKGSLLVTDNVASPASNLDRDRSRRQSFDGGSKQVAELCSSGFVSVTYISGTRIIVQVVTDEGQQDSVDVDVRNDLLVLETCADSTQTLIAALNALKPPVPLTTEIKYRTKVVPVQDLLASLSGNAFGQAEGNYNFEDDFPDAQSSTTGEQDDEDQADVAIDSRHFQEQAPKDFPDDFDDDDDDSQMGSVLFDQVYTEDTADGVLLESLTADDVSREHQEVAELDFQEDHFGTGSIIEGTAHRWNSSKNAYDKSNEHRVRKSPFKVCIRDVHVIWNLFDGYDWQQTRDTISKAVQDVELKALEKKARGHRRPIFEQDLDDDDTVIGDFLFNSIYIGVSANKDPRDLAMVVNQQLNDDATETESTAPTVTPTATSRPGGSSSRSKGKKLRLGRSEHHKITFELKGVGVDMITFPSNSGETQSSVDIRVHDLDIFDHIPSSTWKKFATYMHDAGPRESGTSQIHIEILNVRPMPDLPASEIVLKATVLPLRLHVDQDALDFITRFFEFKDDSKPVHASPADIPFLQRVEVNAIQVKLDFKPKRVDYAGLRSGHTTEFMNFIVLDEANMVMRHTIIYGISGFDKLGKCLNDIWMPDIQRTQLPGILAGLAPVRSLANVGSGFRDLVMVPIEEYKRDGRAIRSIRKGATAFGRTTGTELVKFGAKLAIGTQTVLQGAEQMLNRPIGQSEWDDADMEEEEKKRISPYADQPIGVLQGMKGGYASLSRDLLLVKDAIIAMPGEVMDSGSAQGAAVAVGKGLPMIILRPMIGVTRAVGQTLIGATNSLDPQNRRRVEDKYKRY